MTADQEFANLGGSLEGTTLTEKGDILAWGAGNFFVYSFATKTWLENQVSPTSAPISLPGPLAGLSATYSQRLWAIFAVGAEENQIQYFDGQAWHGVATPADYAPLVLSAGPDGTVALLDAANHVWTLPNGSSTWEPTGGELQFSSVSVAADATIVAILDTSDPDRLVVFDSSTSSWAPLGTSQPDSPIAVDGADAGNLLCLSGDGTLYVLGTDGAWSAYPGFQGNPAPQLATLSVFSNGAPCGVSYSAISGGSGVGPVLAEINLSDSILTALIAETAVDPTLRDDMLSDPATTLESHGVVVPDGVSVMAVGPATQQAIIVLPPVAGSGDADSMPLLFTPFQAQGPRVILTLNSQEMTDYAIQMLFLETEDTNAQAYLRAHLTRYFRNTATIAAVADRMAAQMAVHVQVDYASVAAIREANLVVTFTCPYVAIQLGIPTVTIHVDPGDPAAAGG